MSRAAGYIRVSTEEQSREGISLEMQAAKIRTYCSLHDLELVEIIEDAGISGKSIKARPGVQRLLSLVKSRKVDTVVVYKLDRLARNTVECLGVSEMLGKAGAGFHSLTEKLDTQSAIGRFFFTLVASLAEMERNLISERTAAAMSQKKAKGEYTGGQTPYGFTEVAGKLIPNLDEQRVISHIKSLYAEGYSTRKIVAALAQEGILTRKRTAFIQTQVCRILRAA
jgi:site-specific DNA recombinase